MDDDDDDDDDYDYDYDYDGDFFLLVTFADKLQEAMFTNLFFF